MSWLVPCSLVLTLVTRGVVGFSCTTHFPSLVFYNRIPKTGSTTIRYLVEKSQEQKEYDFVSSTVWTDWHAFSPSALRSHISWIENITADYVRAVYDQHMRFIDPSLFTRSTSLINILRDPVARFTSIYYFSLRGKTVNSMHLRARVGDQVNWTVDECFANPSVCRWLQDPEGGARNINLQTMFLCGHADVCDPANRAAVDVAIGNMMGSYTVVAITERFADSLFLLASRLPSFFSVLFCLLY